ncbi:MAG: DNA methyltransferase [Candidatus Halichondribacter symbioticus]
MANTLYTGDNLYILNGMNSESVDLIYLDPPFNSKRVYAAPIGSKAAGTKFKDIWTWNDVDKECLNSLEDYPELVEYIWSIGRIHSKAMMSYIVFMMQRIIQLHRVLKPTGSLYLHCDPTASHYLKIVLDEVFGKDGFKNEIIWSYRTGGASKQHWSRKHDTILFYAKPKYKHNAMKERIYYDKKFFTDTVDETGKYYADVYLRDVWEDIKPLINTSKERTGYPTQKPLSLLHRIITASSNEGDIVFDPFCGCATTCVAAQQCQRRWIGIDIEKNAVNLLVERLSVDNKIFKNIVDFTHTDKIPQRTDIQNEKPSQPIKIRLFKQQAGVCNGCGVAFEARNLEIDHIIPKSKGGGDYYENFQLLCGSCNRTKGNRTMEYLVAKNRDRDEVIKNYISYTDKKK